MVWILVLGATAIVAVVIVRRAMRKSASANRLVDHRAETIVQTGTSVGGIRIRAFHAPSAPARRGATRRDTATPEE